VFPPKESTFNTGGSTLIDLTLKCSTEVNYMTTSMMYLGREALILSTYMELK